MLLGCAAEFKDDCGFIACAGEPAQSVTLYHSGTRHRRTWMPRVTEQRCLCFRSSLANQLVVSIRIFGSILIRKVVSITARAHLFRCCQRSLDGAEGGGATLLRKLLLDLRRVMWWKGGGAAGALYLTQLLADEVNSERWQCQ